MLADASCEYGLRTHKLTRAVLVYRAWGVKRPFQDFDNPYAYSKLQLSLEGSAGEYMLSLPKTPREATAAGMELRNCLTSYADRVPHQKTVLLIGDFLGRLRGAVEVGDERVLQVRGACNRDMRAFNPDAYDSYLQWRGTKGLEESLVA